jgi:hypothetical protein
MQPRRPDAEPVGKNVTRARDVRSAKEILATLPTVRIPALFNEADRFYSYKLISIVKAVEAVTLSGDFAEFGVYTGRCARFLSTFLVGPRKLFLFDSFEGLPQDWVGQWKAGSFKIDAKDIPKFTNPNVRIIKGWFKDTAPTLSAMIDAPLALVHVDGDLYSSAIDALCNIDDRIAPGTIILFDEYAMENQGQFADDEHRALHDYAAKYRREFEFLWRTEWFQVAVRITK